MGERHRSDGGADIRDLRPGRKRAQARAAAEKENLTPFPASLIVLALQLCISHRPSYPALATKPETSSSVEAGTPAELTALSRRKTDADDFAAGLELARRALGLAAPGSAEEAGARAALGEALFRAGDLDGAGLCFRQALALAPDLASAHHGLARFFLTWPDYERAGEALRRAHQLDPEEPRVIRRLAGLVASRAEAMALYRRYLELPPMEDPEVRDNVRSWLALLEASGDRKLFRLEMPAAELAVRIVRSGGVPLVDVGVGGLPPQPFLLDSGAGGVTIPEGLQRRLRLEPVTVFKVKGLSGRPEERPFVLLPSLAVATAVFRDVPAVVTPARGSPRGIIGLSLLAPLQPSLEGDRRLLMRREASGFPGCPVEDRWRFFNLGGQIGVEVTLGGEPLRFLLDTGAERSVLSRAAVERLGLEESAGGSPIAVSGLTGPAGRVGRLKPKAILSFFGWQENVRGSAIIDLSLLSHSLGTEVDGVLGVDLLGDAALTVDYVHGKIRVRR